MLEVGSNAPNFRVQNHRNETVSLDSLKGTRVVLWFYPKADTPGCTAEGCSFRDLASEFAEKNTKIYGVSFDTPEENAAFAKKFDFKFPLLCDTEREIGLSYGACTSKDAKHANRIGYVISPEGKIAKAYPKVDAAKFPAQVLSEI